jgi:hypothetical protein
VFTAASHNKTIAFRLKSNGFHPNHEKIPGARRPESREKEIPSLPDTANLNAIAWLHRHSPQIAPAVGTGYLTGVAAR